MESNTNRWANRWVTLGVVLLLAVTTSGCAYISERIDRFRSDDGTASPPTVSDGTEAGQTDSAVAGVPAVPETEASDTAEQTAATETAVPDTAGATAGAAQTAATTTGAAGASVTGLNIDRPEDVIEMQRRLKLLGFNPGPVDGVAGPQTLLALARFRDMAGPLGNPGLRVIIDEVVSANEGRDSDEKWWKRRATRAVASTATAAPEKAVIAKTEAATWPSDKAISAQTTMGTTDDVNPIPPTVGMASTQLAQPAPAAELPKDSAADAPVPALTQPNSDDSKAAPEAQVDENATSASVDEVDLSTVPKHGRPRSSQSSEESAKAAASATSPTLGERIKSAWQVTRDKVKQGASKIRGGGEADDQTTADATTAAN